MIADVFTVGAFCVFIGAVLAFCVFCSWAPARRENRRMRRKHGVMFRRIFWGDKRKD